MSDTGMVMTSSFVSTVPAVGTLVADCGLVLTCVLMVFSFARDLHRELVQALAQHPVKRRKWMNDIGERRQRRSQLDCEHELAEDLACTWCDHRRADQHPAFSVSDQLERATVKIVDVAARRLCRIRGGDNDVDPSGPRGTFRKSDGRD